MSVLNDISIGTFNCQGFKYRNFDYIEGLFKSVKILLLQEQWLFDFEYDIFNKVLPNCQYIAKYEMKNDSLNRGRPYGGCAIIWKKDLPWVMEEIPTMSNRLCAVKFESNKSNFLLFCVYMPCNNYDDDDFFGILCEIISICNTYDD